MTDLLLIGAGWAALTVAYLLGHRMGRTSAIEQMSDAAWRRYMGQAK